ncbi:MAG: choice-of-anchor Q domain-containing protein [Verrucomicrobiota bacterium]
MKSFLRSCRTLFNSDEIHRKDSSVGRFTVSRGILEKSRLILAAGFTLGLLPMTAHLASGITVTNANDSGAGSLRQAMIDVPDGGVIDFSAAVFTDASHTITLASELLLTKTATLDASGIGSGVTLTGNDLTRVMSVTAAGNLTLKKLTLRDGNSTGAAASGFGGALFNAGFASLQDCTIADSSALNYGGGVSSSGSLEVIRSTISGNNAGSLGGGIYSASSGTLILKNSTLTGNTAVLFGGAIYHTSPLTLIHATLTGNHAGNKGGGIYNDFGSALTLRSSIVAGNTAPESQNFFGPFTVSSSNLTGGDPKLAPLGNYGGTTLTMPPQPDSPAIDHAEDENLATDQRGFPRDLADGPDIGAVEAEVGDYNPDGLTLHTRVPAADSAGAFEISTDPQFLPIVSTFAGTGVPGLADDHRTSAKFGYPSAVARDELGNVFIADSGNHRIRMIDSSGNLTTIAGSGEFSGLANGPGPNAAFSFPSAVAVGPDGNVYVADTFNHRICKLVRPAVVGGVWTVSTLAGPNSPGNAGFLNQPGTAARFNYPYGIALDAAGNVYVADSMNHRIRKVTPTGGVSTYAGSATSGLVDSSTPSTAKFDTPQAVCVVGTTVYVADTGNNCIRKITSSGSLADAVSTFAGSSTGLPGDSDGTGTAAAFDSPSGIATDGAGALYVADEQNSLIRKITSAGEVTTVAGAGTAGLTNGKSDIAEFDAPTGVMVALDGNLIVADSQNHVLRRIIVENTRLSSSLVSGDVNGAGLQQVSAVIDAAALGLDPGAVYYIRWVSSNGGATQSIGQRFTLYQLPVLTTEPASNLIPTSAQLNATVDPKDNLTEVVFEYSTDPDLLPPYGVSTLAGSLAAGLAGPSGIAADGNGGVYVADRSGNRILRITAAGVVSTFAGSGVAGFANGTGVAAKFEKPGGLAIDASGNLYVADEFNHRIRKITPAGEVSTLAGSGVAGFGDGLANAALFLNPTGVAVDAAGNVLVADTGNHRIRKFSIATGSVATLAGTGVSGLTADGSADVAEFASPRGIAVNAAGSHVWVADTGNQCVRLITSGDVFTLAGDGTAGFADGPGASARFSAPTGIAVDGDGVVFVSDFGNHRIRRVETDGDVSTLAGSGISGTVDSPLTGSGLYPATATQFDSPSGVATDAAGRIFVTQGSIVREIARAAAVPAVAVTPRASGSGDRLVSTDIPQPLLPNTTYYFRAVATNYRGTVTGDTLDFVTPQAGITVADGATNSGPAILDEQAEAVDFGNTPTGQPVTRPITITNPGSYLLNVSSVTLPAGYQLAPGPWVVAPLASVTLDLTLSASTAGTFGGNVTIHSDAPDQAAFSFPITGVVLDPPAVTTLPASDTTGAAATLNASVNPRGSSTSVWFEWSLDPEFDGLTVSTVTGPDLSQPSGLASDAAGNIYVADTLNHRIRKVAPNGTTTTFAGTGVAGFADGPGTSAQFNEPVGLVMTGSGILFVADSKNHCIRAITLSGSVSTFSGLGTPGFTDGIPAAARFNLPSGLAIDGDGTLHVADRGNHRIRLIGPDGNVSTLAGTETAGSTNGSVGVARFDNPVGIAVDSTGNTYVTEAASHAIRKVAPDGTTGIFAGSATVAGMSNAAGATARFSNPAGLAIQVDGTLLVADTGNHLIRSISPTGVTATYVGSGTPGTTDGLGEVARFDQPISLATISTGGVAVGETSHTTLRKIHSTQVLVQAATGLAGTADLPMETSITGLTSGLIYYFRTIATNGGGTTIGATLTFGDPFLSWQIQNFGANATNPLIAGAAATPAQDGVCNLLKYAFNMDPAVSCVVGLPVQGAEEGELSLIFTKVNAATNLVYTPEWSTDLVHWSSAGITQEIMSDDDITQQVCASIPSTAGGAKFLRINVTLQQP